MTRVLSIIVLLSLLIAGPAWTFPLDRLQSVVTMTVGGKLACTGWVSSCVKTSEGTYIVAVRTAGHCADADGVLWNDGSTSSVLTTELLPQDGAKITVYSTIRREALSVGPRPALGDEIWVAGHPFGMSLMISRGIVSGWERDEGGIWMVADYAAGGGVSGGPVFNVAGQVVGTHCSSMMGTMRYIRPEPPLE